MTKPRPYGQYFILEKIAQGGMAEIFKGLTYDFSGLKKYIVIKRILPHISANKEFIQMLIDEAKIAVRLSHGNIAQTYDLGKVADDYFIVMEYVDGFTLSEIYKQSTLLHQNIPIEFSVYLVSEICNGLDYIHRRTDETGKQLGIIHCDISPQNAIVSDSGTVKIVDFGVAKLAMNISSQDTGVLKGKFAYMSPEQMEGDHIDCRTDIFSAGVVLWELLTGKRLFKRKIKSETIRAVQTMPIEAPSVYRKEIPAELDQIVLKALQRNPKKRYQSATDMALALTKFNLRHFPDFKPSLIGEYLSKLFDSDDLTGEFQVEKTQSSVVRISGGAAQKSNIESPDDTEVVDPKELDFHSVFEELDLEDISEVTQALQEDEVKLNKKVQKEDKAKVSADPRVVQNENEMFEKKTRGGLFKGIETKWFLWTLLVFILILVLYITIIFFVFS